MTKAHINKAIKTINVSEEFGVTENQRTEYTLSWFYVAKENLLSAKTLFDAQQFAHCIFFIQQCIECIIKGILLENKIIVDAKALNHNPENIIEEFYKLMNSDSQKHCEYIKTEMRDKIGFENRIIHMKSIFNNYMRKYNEALEEVPPSNFIVYPDCYSAIGASNKDSREHLYKHLQTIFYTHIFIFCFAILFSDVQQNTRYPIPESGCLMPIDKYPKSATISEGLSTILPTLDFIIRTILY